MKGTASSPKALLHQVIRAALSSYCPKGGGRDEKEEKSRTSIIYMQQSIAVWLRKSLCLALREVRFFDDEVRRVNFQKWKERKQLAFLPSFLLGK